MTREALKKLNEKQMNYCKTLSVLIDRAKISGYEVKALYLWFISGNRGE